MRSSSKFLLKAALQEYSTSGVRNTLEECYTCDVSSLPHELSSCFVQLAPDEETETFLDTCRKQSSNMCLQLLYGIVQVLLGLFMSQTSINGLLERGRMFVFSRQQLRTLLSSSHLTATPTTTTTHPLSVLDIGSGDGHVTGRIREVLQTQTVHVTETCRVMRRILERNNYKVLNVDSWHLQANSTYDLISCLNVLDRCDRPLSMLRQITDSLRPGGILLIALVHPYKPFVERNWGQSRPAEELRIDNKSWERGVASLWDHTLKPLGYTPLAVSRVPYICEGDFSQDYYILDDALLVLKKSQV